MTVIELKVVIVESILSLEGEEEDAKNAEFCLVALLARVLLVSCLS